MPPTYFPYLSILASAGSGKTFRLSYRTLQLLEMGATPEQIGAFTFSRKAAGEIFDSVVEALRAAAERPEGAEAASTHINATRRPEEFLQDLRRVIHALPHLKIGTLDAHIARYLSAVSVELGLPPDFALQDDRSSEQVRLRREILNRLFQSHALTEERAALFLELFEEATHGKSTKEFLRPMLEFLEGRREVFRAHPHRSAWQGPALASPPVCLPETERRSLADRIIRQLKETELPAKAVTSLCDFASTCAEYGPGSVWSKELKLTKPVQWVLAGDSPVLTYNRTTTELPGPVWDGLQKLADQPVAIEWEKVRRKTEALWAFLAVFEQAYQQQAVSGGQLTFEDACALLGDVDQIEPSELAYRLDGEIHHWLLDEFQDTSRSQWKVLDPFLSEILQDPEERRSLFLVGDVKQAIYGWRGGDAGLFEHVLDSWPQIHRTSMAVSYRSAQPVLDAVNALFSDLPSDDAVSPATAERWNRAFEPHQAANPDLSGKAEIHQCEKDGLTDRDIVMAYLRTLPEEAGCALLVRSNREGDAWAMDLREAGFQVSREGTSPLRGHPVIELVLAGLRLTAHPADPFSRRMVQMAGLKEAGIAGLQQVQEQGLTGLVRMFSQQILNQNPSAFSRSRLTRLEEEALEFDRARDPDIDAFLEHVDELSVRETGSGAGIRIMTVHQCKGLGFDAVIVPFASGAGFTHRIDGLVTSPPEEAEDWVTLLPPKDVCLRVPELREILDQENDRAAYETLCVLYVAMTRAKRSLLITLPPPTRTPTVFGNWIPARLGVDAPSENGTVAQWGNDDWLHETRTPPEPVRTPPTFPLPDAPPRISRLEPSREQGAATPVAREFAHPGEDGRRLGSRVHDLLEQVDFPAGSVEAYLQEQELEEEDPVVPHLRNAWQMELLQKPDGMRELWREQKFETLLPEGWVTGVFDRVVLFEGRAWIQDYKTNRNVSGETVEHYRPQMELYRRVLADMLDLSEADITCHLLFTATGKAATL